MVTNVSGASRAKGTKGGSWAALGTAGKEPLEVRKRSPQTLDQWVGVRLGLFVVSFSCALLPFEFQQTHFRKACVETPAARTLHVLLTMRA